MKGQGPMKWGGGGGDVLYQYHPTIGTFPQHRKTFHDSIRNPQWNSRMPFR